MFSAFSDAHVQSFHHGVNIEGWTAAVSVLQSSLCRGNGSPNEIIDLFGTGEMGECIHKQIMVS
jgi:hypothetical protein